MLKIVVPSPVEYTTTAVLVTIAEDAERTTATDEAVIDVVVEDAEKSDEEDTAAGVVYEVIEDDIEGFMVDVTIAVVVDGETTAMVEDTLEAAAELSDEELEATTQATLRSNCTPLLVHTVLRSAAAAVEGSAILLLVRRCLHTMLIATVASCSKAAQKRGLVHLLTDADIV